MTSSKAWSSALLVASGLFAALIANGCGDSSSSDGASGGGGASGGSGGSGGTGASGGSVGGGAGAGNASGYCGALPFVQSCFYPVGSQDCSDLYGAWAPGDSTCGTESVRSDEVCVVPTPVPVCVVRTCEVRWQVADAGVIDAGVDSHPWQCPATGGCDGLSLLGSCDSAAEGRCVDHYTIVTDTDKARTRLESRCVASGGVFSTSACAVTGTTPSCRREQCTVVNDLYISEGGFPAPCEGVYHTP